MKKLLLLIGLAFTATLSCTAQQHTLIGFTPKGDSIVSIPIKTVTQPPVVVVPPIIDFNTLTAAENVFDYVWGVYGLPVGSEVNKLVTRKGGVDIVWQGRTATTVPALTMDGKLPIMVDPYYERFNNRPSLQNNSASIPAVQPPYEIWYVFRSLPSATYEGLTDEGTGKVYLANNGGDGVRILNSNQSGKLTTAKWPSPYATHIAKIIVNNLNSASLYFDNVLQGTRTLTSGDYNFNKLYFTNFNIGVTTNNQDWDFAAMYFKKGLVTDSAGTYKALAAKWQVGSLPNQILLTNLGITKSNGTYTPASTIFYTPVGVKPADQSQWVYQWYYYYQHPNASFLDYQVPFSTKYQVTAKDLPAGISTTAGLQLKVVIIPKDSNGNLSGPIESTGFPF